MIKNRILSKTAEIGKLKLDYYLLESEIDAQYDEELIGKTVYGIEILKTDLCMEADNIGEKHTVENFSCDRETTELFLDKLARNTVTPVTLPCIVDDAINY